MVTGSSLVVQWLGLRTFTAEGSETKLRSHKLHGTAGKKKDMDTGGGRDLQPFLQLIYCRE